MQQKETVLTPAQEVVIAELMAGRSITKAAKKGKVSRSTVHRWLHEPDFRSEYGRRKLEIRDAVQTRLLTLADGAVGCIEKALKNGDEKIALTLLKGLDLMAPGRHEKPDRDAPPPAPPEPRTPVSLEEERRELERIWENVQKRKRLPN